MERVDMYTDSDEFKRPFFEHFKDTGFGPAQSKIGQNVDTHMETVIKRHKRSYLGSK